MRIGHGASPIPNPERQIQQDDGQHRPGRSSVSREYEDRVLISKEARNLQSGRAAGRVGLPDAERVDGRDVEEARERMESGFYDSRQSRLKLADELLTLFGL